MSVRKLELFLANKMLIWEPVGVIVTKGLVLIHLLSSFIRVYTFYFILKTGILIIPMWKMAEPVGFLRFLWFLVKIFYWRHLKIYSEFLNLQSWLYYSVSLFWYFCWWFCFVVGVEDFFRNKLSDLTDKL